MSFLNFTGPQDCSRTHHGEDSDLTEEGLEVMVRAVTGEIFVPEHMILPQGVITLCEDSSLRTEVLATLPTLDDGGLAARQTGGDPDRGIRIPGASGEQAVPSATGPVLLPRASRPWLVALPRVVPARAEAAPALRRWR